MKYEYNHPMAGVTATMVIFNPHTYEVLLGKRKENSDAFPGAWCLPGGYLNVGTEQLVNVARRETREETGLDITEDRWYFFYNDDKPGSDPRYLQVINLCYWAAVTQIEYESVKAADDLTDLKWVKFEDALTWDLAFAHNEILRVFVSLADEEDDDKYLY